MNKKIILTLISFLLLTTAIACGKENNKEKGVDSSKSTTLLTQINEAKPEHIIDPFENLNIYFDVSKNFVRANYKYSLGFPNQNDYESENDITYISNIDDISEYELIDFINDKFILKATLDDNQKDKFDDKYGEGNWELSRTVKEFSYKDEVYTRCIYLNDSSYDLIYPKLIVPIYNVETYNLIVEQLDKYISDIVNIEFPGNDFVIKNKLMENTKSIINNIETNYFYDYFQLFYYLENSKGEIIKVIPDRSIFMDLDGNLITEMLIGTDETQKIESGTNDFALNLSIYEFNSDVSYGESKEAISPYVSLYNLNKEEKPSLDMVKESQMIIEKNAAAIFNYDKDAYLYTEIPLGKIQEEDFPKDFYKVYVPEEFKEEETPVRSNKPKAEQDNYSPVVTTNVADYYLNTTRLTAKKN